MEYASHCSCCRYCKCRHETSRALPLCLLVPIPALLYTHRHTDIHTHTCTCTHAQAQEQSTHTHTHTHLSVCVCVYVCTYVHTRKARGGRGQTSRSNIVDDYEEPCCSLLRKPGVYKRQQASFFVGFVCRGVAQSPNCHQSATCNTSSTKKPGDDRPRKQQTHVMLTYHVDHCRVAHGASSYSWTLFSSFASQSLHNKKKIKKKSGDVNYEANFPPFFFASEVTAPILPPCPRAHLPARTQTLYSPL
jgi:hypothetical protein